MCGIVVKVVVLVVVVLVVVVVDMANFITIILITANGSRATYVRTLVVRTPQSSSFSKEGGVALGVSINSNSLSLP